MKNQTSHPKRIKERTKDHIAHAFLSLLCALVLITALMSVIGVSMAHAKTVYAQTDDEMPNIKSNDFKLIICDGPDYSEFKKEYEKQGKTYVVCDFKAVMTMVKRVINLALVFGVLAAIVMFTYAGYLYVTGVPAKVSQAHDIFRKVAIGFVIMLVAWFVVFQILTWLGVKDVFKSFIS